MPKDVFDTWGLSLRNHGVVEDLKPSERRSLRCMIGDLGPILEVG
jgi:hypothetical protein